MSCSEEWRPNPPHQLFLKVNLLALTCWQIPGRSRLWVFNALIAKEVPSSRAMRAYRVTALSYGLLKCCFIPSEHPWYFTPCSWWLGCSCIALGRYAELHPHRSAYEQESKDCPYNLNCAQMHVVMHLRFSVHVLHFQQPNVMVPPA